MIKVGVVVGHGTGRELAEVFQRGVRCVAEATGKQVEVIECEHVFNSYHHLLDWPPERVGEAVRDDAERLADFYRRLYRAGGRAVFRTAINAETLYLFRALGKAVKTVYIPLRRKRLLVVRDETQGFYSNDSWEFDEGEIRFGGSFSRDNFGRVAGYTAGEAGRRLRGPYDTWLIYKHHLFANLIETWGREFFPGAKFFQPNHATDLLFGYLDDEGGRDLLAVMGNETGDILHEVLIFKLALGTRNTLASRNVYLHPDLHGLVEYQTVHGSADAIAGQGVVNPLATLRALGEFVEEHMGEEDFGTLMGEAIARAEQAGARSRDRDGQSPTDEVADAVLEEVGRLLRGGG